MEEHDMYAILQMLGLEGKGFFENRELHITGQKSLVICSLNRTLIFMACNNVHISFPNINN